MTLRIDTELLEILRAHSKAEGRSASAEVVRLIRKELNAAPKTKRQPTMGMFSHFEAPALHELSRLRRKFSGKLAQSTQRRVKRT